MPFRRMTLDAAARGFQQARIQAGEAAGFSGKSQNDYDLAIRRLREVYGNVPAWTRVNLPIVRGQICIYEPKSGVAPLVMRIA